MSLIDAKEAWENFSADGLLTDQLLKVILKNSLSPLDGTGWNNWSITYGTPSDVITFYKDALLVKTFTVTYSDFRKKKPISGAWT